MKLSFCSTCKGRLWQLRETLNANLESIKDNPEVEWVILDFNCPDKTSDVLSKYPPARRAIESGQLKVFKLNKEFKFDIPLAKNLAHMLGAGDVLFNLDIDNLIGDSVPQLIHLLDTQMMHTDHMYVTGTVGRIGLTRSRFDELGGYDLSLYGAGAHDIDLIARAKRSGCTEILERNIPKAIGNSKAETTKFLDQDYHFYLKNQYRRYKENTARKIVSVNPNGNTIQDDVNLLEFVERVL